MDRVGDCPRLFTASKADRILMPKATTVVLIAYILIALIGHGFKALADMSAANDRLYFGYEGAVLFASRLNFT
jgi:hypothetical protein